VGRKVIPSPINTEKGNDPKTILIVDDETPLVNVISKMLRKESYRVTSAADGKTAWNIYMEIKPDLVLTNIRMPEMDGLKLLARIKGENPSTPVIIMTGFHTPRVRQEAKKLGVDVFISKPFKLNELLENIERLF
jgi:CheY-like chemotaxis protein